MSSSLCGHCIQKPIRFALFGDIDKYDKQTINAILMSHELGIADDSEVNFMQGKLITCAQVAKILVNTANILEQIKE